MPRPRLPDDQRMETVSARVPRDMLGDIDRYLLRMQEETPLLLLNRADAIRQLLAIALQAERKKGRMRG